MATKSIRMSGAEKARAADEYGQKARRRLDRAVTALVREELRFLRSDTDQNDQQVTEAAGWVEEMAGRLAKYIHDGSI